jgi:hypothetical protein
MTAPTSMLRFRGRRGGSGRRFKVGGGRSTAVRAGAAEGPAIGLAASFNVSLERFLEVSFEASFKASLDWPIQSVRPKKLAM